MDAQKTRKMLGSLYDQLEDITGTITSVTFQPGQVVVVMDMDTFRAAFEGEDGVATGGLEVLQGSVRYRAEVKDAPVEVQ